MKSLLVILALVSTLAQAANPVDELTLAAERDHGPTVSALLKRGLHPNAPDSQGRSALAVALREVSPDTIEALLADKRTDFVTPNANGETPLMLAAIKGRLDWVKAFAARGAAVDLPGRVWTPLHYACSGPDKGVTAWLLAQGADINARSPNGTTPLMMAARYGSSSSAEVLLKAGADAKLRNDKDLTAADFARSAGNDRLAKQIEAAAAK